jgi:outer membrane receptor for Fe3+-dicitrate
MSRWLVTSAVAAIIANASSAAVADDQQPQPTDVGEVSTSGHNTQTVVKPSPETDRAGPLAEKKDAANIVDAQPLSEIVKLPDVNMAEALQRVPGISIEEDTGEGRFTYAAWTQI